MGGDNIHKQWVKNNTNPYIKGCWGKGWCFLLLFISWLESIRSLKLLFLPQIIPPYYRDRHKNFEDPKKYQIPPFFLL